MIAMVGLTMILIASVNPVQNGLATPGRRGHMMWVSAEGVFSIVKKITAGVSALSKSAQVWRFVIKKTTTVTDRSTKM